MACGAGDEPEAGVGGVSAGPSSDGVGGACGFDVEFGEEVVG